MIKNSQAKRSIDSKIKNMAASARCNSVTMLCLGVVMLVAGYIASFMIGIGVLYGICTL